MDELRMTAQEINDRADEVVKISKEKGIEVGWLAIKMIARKRHIQPHHWKAFFRIMGIELNRRSQLAKKALSRKAGESPQTGTLFN